MDVINVGMSSIEYLVIILVNSSITINLMCIIIMSEGQGKVYDWYKRLIAATEWSSILVAKGSNI